MRYEGPSRTGCPRLSTPYKDNETLCIFTPPSLAIFFSHTSHSFSLFVLQDGNYLQAMRIWLDLKMLKFSKNALVLSTHLNIETNMGYFTQFWKVVTNNTWF